jgi:hypothetical protein
MGGWTLRGAAQDDGLAHLIGAVRWDDVVLQEQSQIPSFPQQVVLQETYPFARALADEAARAGGRTILFMTWGYRDGNRSSVPGDTFAVM